jgi:hypothetical protein
MFKFFPTSTVGVMLLWAALMCAFGVAVAAKIVGAG